MRSRRKNKVKEQGGEHAKQDGEHVQRFTITDVALPRSVDLDRRQFQYLVSQTIRLVCIALIFVVDHWFWRIIFALGAILLPWVAVLRANNNVKNQKALEKPSLHTHQILAPAPHMPNNDRSPKTNNNTGANGNTNF